MTTDEKTTETTETTEAETPTNTEQELGTETRDLPCKLTVAEKAKVAAQLADIPPQIAQADRDLASHNATFKTRKAECEGLIARLSAEQGKLATAYRDGQELRAVECKRIGNFVTGTIEIIRVDTEETVSSRPMTEGEKQMHLVPQGDEDTDGDAAEEDLGIRANEQGGIEYDEDADTTRKADEEADAGDGTDPATDDEPPTPDDPDLDGGDDELEI